MSMTILVKIVSGDLIPVDVNKNITYKQLYQHVYSSLPTDLRPKSLWQVSLSHILENGEYEEIKETDEAVFKTEENKENFILFCVLNEEYNYIVNIGRDYDAYERTKTEYKDYLFELRSIEIDSWTDGNHNESYLYHPYTNTFYLIDGVSLEIHGTFNDDFMFKLPDNSTPFFSFSDLLDYMLNRLDFNSRKKEYFKSIFMEKYIKKYNYNNSDNEEEYYYQR